MNSGATTDDEEAKKKRASFLQVDQVELDG
jgi:hypothetical protein